MTRSLQQQRCAGAIRSDPPNRIGGRAFATMLADADRAVWESAPAAGVCMAKPSRALVVGCAERLIAADYDAAAFRDWIGSRAGADVAELMLNVLTLAARELGDMWLEDSCSFADVTIGMHRLTMMLVDLEPPHADPLARPQHGGTVLLAPAPGDQHGFGLAMVGFFLRQAGWDVRADIAGEPEAILRQTAARHYDVVGFSIGHERAIAPVADLIAGVRRVSRNRRVVVVVGGPMMIGRPDRAREMGADIHAEDAAELVGKIEPLVPMPSI